MGLVTLDELEVNFAHGYRYPDSDTTLYSFGILDEQVVLHEHATIVESHLVPHYLAISTNSLLGRQLRQIAHVYHCMDIEKSDRIFIPNPNGKFTQQPVSFANSMFIHFIGILCSPDNVREILIQIV